MMKMILILVSLSLYLNGRSQENRFYKAVDFKILNSENEHLQHAQVVVDGRCIPYDSTRQCYLLIDTFRMFFDITVSCDGYEPLNYSRTNLSDSGTDFFSSFIYLKRPSEKMYYAADYWFKIPYTPHPDKLLVILDSRKFPQDDRLRIRFEHELKQHGLTINHSFIKAPATPFEQWKFSSYVGLQDRLIIQKEDGSDFDTDYCPELAYLRNLEMVYTAGPLIRRDTYNITTFDNTIHLYNPYRYYKDEEIHQFVKQLDERFYYDATMQSIILPPETNEIVPQIMEQLKQSGFKASMIMNIHSMKALN